MKLRFPIVLLSFFILIVSSILVPVTTKGDILEGSFNPLTTDCVIVIENKTVTNGTTFQVNVTGYPGSAIKGWQFTLEFNSSLLQAENVTEGDIFEPYPTLFDNGTINNTEGNISMMYNVITNANHVNDEGICIHINFTAIGVGVADITFKYGGPEFEPHFQNETIHLPTVPVNGTVTISSTGSPSQENPYPSNGATGVETTPMLNITCNDGNGEQMDIYWYSNSSGSWQQFAYNQSTNGTFHWTNSNFSSMGETYYWSVNATDGEYWSNETYHFTTLTVGSVEFTNPYPQNTSIQQHNNTTMNITVSNPLGEEMNIYFYWFNNSTLIGSDLSVSNNSVANITLSSNYTFYEQYYWNVTVVSSNYNNQSGNFTIQAESEHPDIDRDGKVYPSDLSLLVSNYMTEGGSPRFKRADINFDGKIYPSDLSILVSNYMTEY